MPKTRVLLILTFPDLFPFIIFVSYPGGKEGWFLLLHTFALSPVTLNKFLRRSFWRFQLISTLSFLVFGVYLALNPQPVNWPVLLVLL